MGPILCIGEVMAELSEVDLAAGRARVAAAGDTANMAIHLARALPGRTVGYVTVLGRDGLSDQIAARLAAEGVDTTRIGRHPDRLPGLYAVERDAAGERSFRYWRSQSAARTMFTPGLPGPEVLDGAAAVALSLITLAILTEEARAALIGRLAALRAAGTIIAFDSNYRPALWPSPAAAAEVCDAMWRVTTLALPSADDEARLHGSETAETLFARLARHGVTEIALKDGARGARLWHAGAEVAAGPFPPAGIIVDTAGAGDAFDAGYIAARLTGHGPAAAAAAGHAAALRTLAHPGAVPPRAA